MQIFKYFNHLLLSTIILLIPFLDFLNHNWNEADIILGNSFYILIFIIFSIFSIIILLFKFFFKSDLYNLILVFGLSFWLFFQYDTFKKLYEKLSLFFNLSSFKLSSEFSLLLICIILFFSSYFILKNNALFKRFLFFFFIINFFYLIVNLIFIEKNQNLQIYSNNEKIIYQDFLNKKKENIYFFILDGMQPIGEFKKHYSFNKNIFLDKAKENNYTYNDNIINFYGNTIHNLSSIFYLDTIFDKKTCWDEDLSCVITKKKINKLFPTLMRKNYNPDLLYNLQNLGYDFKWIGNFFAYCPKFNLTYCVEEEKNKIFDAYLYISFFSKTPFIPLISKYGVMINYDFDKKIFYMLNNGIGRLINYLQINSKRSRDDKPIFYFIHHMSPHWPYLNKADCSYNKYEGKENFDGYESAYLCTLNRIDDMINFLKKHDPNATVVFQGDHSWEMSNSSEVKYGLRRKVFSLTKLDKSCNYDKNANINNVNVVRLILSCITGSKINFIKNED